MEIMSGTHWIRSWVGPKASVDTVVKRNIPIIAPPRNCYQSFSP